MTDTTYYKNHNTYGGRIYECDFGHRTLSDITGQILSDMRFDEQCRKNIESKERNKAYAK